MVGQGGDERRRYPRIPVSWPVRLWVDRDSLVGEAVEASPYGLYVLTAPTAALKLGSCYRVEIMAGEAGDQAYLGEVRHVDVRGVGLETKQVLQVA